ncbi:MAG: amino-acid N-acetyltransferase [Bradymonadia bacterium]
MTDDLDVFSVSGLRQASPYINEHRDKTFVVLLQGELLQHDNATAILHDLVLLHSLGIRLVIVHGSRPQIDRMLNDRGIQTEVRDGYRITTRETMQYVAQVVGSQRMLIEAHLSTDMEASPMRGAKVRVVSGNFIIAKPRGIIDGTDYQYAGDVRGVDTAGINNALNNRQIVLISHIGYSRTGEMFNLACESVAAEVSISLGADKLILFTKSEGLMADHSLVRHSTPSESIELSQTEPNRDEKSLFVCAAKASENGVERAHIVSYAHDEALLTELFTRDGAGSLITHQEIETLRPALATDTGRLIHLLQPLEENGTLVKRSRQLLEREIQQFFVIEKEQVLIGSAALYPLPNSSSGELACLAVHPHYRRGGRGDRLLRKIETMALERKLEYLFVLTTKTAHWFIERGFEEVSIDALPSERKDLYNFQRNSKVFQKHLKRTKNL